MNNLAVMTRKRVHMSTKVLATKPGNLLGYWPLDDAAGSTTAREASGAAGNLITNPGFEIAGAGGGDVWASWNEYPGASGGTVTDETTIVHSGGHACKLVEGSTNGQCYVVHTFMAGGNDPALIVGGTYKLRFWTRGDGTNDGLYYVSDVTHSTFLVPYPRTGVTGTSWVQITSPEFTIVAGTLRVDVYLKVAAGAGATVYFDDFEMIPVGSNPLALPLAGTGSIFGVPGLHGSTALKLDGNGYLETTSMAVLNRFINGAVTKSSITYLAWVQVGVTWEPGAGVHYSVFDLYADANNYIRPVRSADEYFYHNPLYAWAASSIHALSAALNYKGSSWFALLGTINQSTGVVRSYPNGVFDNEYTGGSAMTALPTAFRIGTDAGHTWNHIGGLAHVALWDTVLTDAEIKWLGRQ